jgi:hypothetical protein
MRCPDASKTDPTMRSNSVVLSVDAVTSVASTLRLLRLSGTEHTLRTLFFGAQGSQTTNSILSASK